MAVRLIFSFDSEDFITPEAAEAEKWWAETMTKHGVTACICVVGELVRSLSRMGRVDVLSAMASHEIAYHSNKHSIPPTWAEMLDNCGWHDGIEKVVETELKGVNDVREVFGQNPSAWCKPGNSWGAQVAAAMSLLDIPVFCDSPFALQKGQPFWFANTLMLQYHTSFDNYSDVKTNKRLRQMQEDFEALCHTHNGGYLIMFTHPAKLVTAEFWDAINFKDGKATEREHWKPAPLRPEREVEAMKQDFELFLSWAVRQPQVELTTYRQLINEYKPIAPIWLSLKDVLQIAPKIHEFKFQFVRGQFLSPAEQFGILIRTLAFLAREGRLPEAICLRRLFGPTKMPPTEIQKGEVSTEEFLKAALYADEFCDRTGCVSDHIPLGREFIGPNAFMQGAAQLLKQWQTNQLLPASISLNPFEELPKIASDRQFCDYHFKGTWVIFPPDFEGKRTLEHIKLQTWTIKPAVPFAKSQGKEQ